MHYEKIRVISFKTDVNERINIYYTTRTIGIVLNHPFLGRIKLFYQNCTNKEIREILQNPRLHAGKGYKKCTRVDSYYNSMYSCYNYKGDGNEYIDKKNDYQNQLLEYEREEETILVKKIRLRKALKTIDDKLSNDATKIKAKIEVQEEELK